MGIKGFCILKNYETVRGYRGNLAELLGVPLVIIDVAVDKSGFLILNKQQTVVLPPNLSLEQKLVESGKRITRKGGYNKILTNMVIAGSLAKGVFNDDFLFELQ